MEEFLSSHGVLYEHHNLLTDTQAVEDLRRRGIKSLPVTIVDDTEVIIGYYPKKLIPALKLDVTVDLSKYAGTQIQLRIENRANDWRNEWAYWHEVKVVSRAPRTAP